MQSDRPIVQRRHLVLYMPEWIALMKQEQKVIEVEVAEGNEMNAIRTLGV